MGKQLFVNRLQLFLLLSCCYCLVTSECNNDSCIHGSCEGGLCVCDQLWYGENCNVFICDTDPCLNFADCIKFNNSSFTCDCKPGFVGNFCQSPEITVSELCYNPNKCSSHGTCVRDYAGNESCLCDRGYTGEDCSTEVDKCLSRGCHNGGTCYLTNDGPGFNCSCPAGYSYLSQCLLPIVDHCFYKPCAHGECKTPVPILSDGPQYYCECEEGYYGINCNKTVCDISSPCSNGGNCSVLEEDLTQYSCTCPPYFTGDNCETEVDPCDWHTCFNNGSCSHEYTSNGVGSYNYTATCDCVEGYEGPHCVDDIDECADDPCQNDSRCINTYGGFVCVCPDGFNGSLCDVNIDDCQPNPCLNGGTCTDGVNSYSCNCASTGFTGLTCDRQVNITCEGAQQECNSRGKCIFDDSLQFSVCECDEGFSGHFCENHYQPCLSAGCNVEGTLECFPTLCICKDGYSGDKCDRHDDDYSGYMDCGDFSCENGGTCIELQDGTKFCKCPSEWGGVDCSHDVDECSQSPCGEGSHCLNLMGGFTCICQRGLTGPLCDIIDCSVYPCRHGECINASYCKCDEGYGGSFCDKTVPSTACPYENCTALANNEQCDRHCFSASCGYDGGHAPCYTRNDIDPWANCTVPRCRSAYNNDYCDPECNTPDCIYDGNDCYWTTSSCPTETIDMCLELIDNGVCNDECHTRNCSFDISDCGNQIYLPGYLVLVLESPHDVTFSDDVVYDFIAVISRIIHAIVEVVSYGEIFLTDLDAMVVSIANTDDNNKRYWKIVLRIDIQFCERSCPTSVEQALQTIQAAYSSGDTSFNNFGLVDAYVTPDDNGGGTEGSGASTTVVISIVAFCVCAVMVIVVVVILGKRVRDNGGIKEAIKKVKVRHTWNIPGGNTPEPSELLRDSSGVSDRRSTSIDTTTDSSPNSLRKETMPHITWSKMEAPSGDGTCIIAERGHDDRKWSMLHHYAARHTNDVHRLPREGNVNVQGPGGFTPLMIAIISDEKERNKRNRLRAGPVRSDSSSGSEHSEYEALLTSSSPRIQQMGRHHGMAPYQHALMFITQQTDLNITNDQGQTALHIAAKHGRGDYVQQLLRANADPNVQDNGGLTPLHVAIGAAADGSFEVLLSHHKTNTELKSVSGVTPLMLAVKMANKRMVHMLVEKNAEIAATDNEGRTAVHWAAMVNNVDALKLLVKQGPDNVKDVPNIRGETALFLACKEGCIESVQHLLDCFANATLLDGLDRSPMQIAYEKQHTDIVELLRHSNQGSLVPPSVYTKGSVSTHNPMFNRVGSIKMESGVGVVMPSYPQTTTSLPVAMSLPSSHYLEGTSTTPHLPTYTHQQVPPTFTSSTSQQATGMPRCTSIEAELERLVSSELSYPLPPASQEQYLPAGAMNYSAQTQLDTSPGHTSDVSPGLSGQGGISPTTIDPVSTGYSPASSSNTEGYPSPNVQMTSSTYPSNSYVGDGGAMKQPIYTTALQPGGHSPLVGQTVSPNPPLVLAQAHPGYSPSTSSDNKSPSLMYSFPSPPKEAGEQRYLGTTYHPDTFNYYTPSPEDGSGQIVSEPSPPLQTRLHGHVAGGYQQQQEGIPLGAPHMYDCIQQTVLPLHINTHSRESTV